MALFIQTIEKTGNCPFARIGIRGEEIKDALDGPHNASVAKHIRLKLE